jgi:hypothetical protein
MIDDFSPQMRVALAVAPFLVSILTRIIFGRRTWTRWFVTVSTMWFATNVLLAPHSAGIRRQVMGLGSVFR